MMTVRQIKLRSLLLLICAVCTNSRVEAQLTPSRNATTPSDSGQMQIQPIDVTLLPNGPPLVFSAVGLAPGEKVHWQVNGEEAGNSVVGTIESSGTYKPPQAAPPVPVVITAFVSDVKQATATVTIAQPACTAPKSAACIKANPGTVVRLNHTTSLEFVPKVGQTGTIKWSVNGQPDGNDSVGRLKKDGERAATYTAPSAVVPAVTAAADMTPALGPVARATTSITLVEKYISIRCTGKDVRGVKPNGCRVTDFNRLKDSIATKKGEKPQKVKARKGIIDNNTVNDGTDNSREITPASQISAINSSKALTSGSLLEITFPNQEIAGNCKNYDWKIVTQAKESPNILIYNPSDIGSGVCVDGKFLIALPVHVLWADVTGYEQFADPSRTAPVGVSSYTDCFGQPAPETILPCDRYANWRIATFYKLANVQRLFGQSGAAQGTVSLSPVIGSGLRQLGFDIQADPGYWTHYGWIDTPIVFEKNTTAGSNLDSFLAGVAFDTRSLRKPNFYNGSEHFKIRKPQFRIQTGAELAPTTPHDLNWVESGTVKIPFVFTFHQQPSALTAYPVIGIEGGSHLDTHLAEPDPVLRGLAGVDGSFRWPYNLGHAFLGSSPITVDYSYRMRWLAYAEPTTNPAGTGTEVISAGRHGYFRASFIAPFTANFQFQTTVLIGSLPPNFKVLSPTLTMGLTFSNPGSSEH